MSDIIIDTVLDGIKLIPFLLIAFIIIEIIEHKLTEKNKKIITKSKKFGPILGAFLGLIPQCGFSVLATNLYITRIISLGTLIAIYLSTSDEMLPILLSEKVSIIIILKVLSLKVIISIVIGIMIDLIISKIKKSQTSIDCLNYNICEEEHCGCHEEKGILKSALIHAIKTLLFILIFTFMLNILFYYVNEDTIISIWNKNNLLTPFIVSLIGLIPNCGSSIMITELFIKGIIPFSSLIAGLLTGSGVALLVLFKQNKNLKENMLILFLIYLVGSFSGLIIEIFNKII